MLKMNQLEPQNMTTLFIENYRFLARFANQGVEFVVLAPELLAVPDGSDYTSDLHPDWADLKHTRDALDAAIEQWLDDMQPDFLTSSMRYVNTKGVQRVRPAWQTLTHLLNHQTHHRGQVTTLLMQAGVDVGVTDLIALV